MNDRLLRIYLTDHLAAATAGVALAQRSARNNLGNETGAFLERLTDDIEQDRLALARLVRGLGFTRSKPKEAIASIGEKVGRLKLNGRLFAYSPLSRVLELEALSVGIAGKLELWEALQRLSDLDGRLDATELEQLAERAQRQRAEVEEHRLRAARHAFGGAGAPRAEAATERQTGS